MAHSPSVPLPGRRQDRRVDNPHNTVYAYTHICSPRAPAFFERFAVSRLTPLALAAAVWAAAATPARADYEYWSTFETRIPLASRAPLTGQPLALRMVSDLRYGLRYPGLGWDFFRIGPLWTVAPGCFVGTHFTTVAVQAPPGALTQEYRAELEPNFFGRQGDVAWSARNRLEYRWRANDQHFRFRHMLRLAYAPDGARWIPFVWDEPMIELNADGLAQNRFQLGVGTQLGPHLRLDVGAMLRSRATAGVWDHDYILNTFLYFAPALGPVFDPTANTGE